MTGKIAFDDKGDIKDGAMTVFQVKGGKRETVESRRWPERSCSGRCRPAAACSRSGPGSSGQRREEEFFGLAKRHLRVPFLTLNPRRQRRFGRPSNTGASWLQLLKPVQNGLVYTKCESRLIVNRPCFSPY